VVRIPRHVANSETQRYYISQGWSVREIISGKCQFFDMLPKFNKGKSLARLNTGSREHSVVTICMKEVEI